ncbi:MAG: hypothetical protein V3U84_03420 [Thiotrichaceae bacterium]
MSAPDLDIDTQLNNSLGYAMLLMDGLKLLIPQKQIIALEMTNDIELSQTNDDSVVGYLQFKNMSWPIFCFNSELSLLSAASLSRRFCVLLQSDSASFGILSEQALLLNSGQIDPQQLPEAMLTATTPISGLAVHMDEVICISSAKQLAKQLPLDMESGT